MQQPAPVDKAPQAVAWLLLGISGGLGLDLCAKQLLLTYPLVQFVFLRSLLGLVLFLLLAPLFGGWRGLSTLRPGWHLLRTVLAIGSMFGFFYGLASMPLVNALTLGFTAPLMMTALSVPLLGEAVGWRRWLAVLAGFGGVLLVLRPGSGLWTPPALAVLFAAFCYACLALTSRHLGRTESSYALAVYVVVGPLLAASALLHRQQEWLVPDLAAGILFLLAGACSVVAWLGLINGYRHAPPALLAPLEYLALALGTLAGFVFWGEIPDYYVLAGAAIIVTAGIYVVYREIGTRVRPRRP